jgi:hypothetical protein
MARDVQASMAYNPMCCHQIKQHMLMLWPVALLYHLAFTTLTLQSLHVAISGERLLPTYPVCDTAVHC